MSRSTSSPARRPNLLRLEDRLTPASIHGFAFNDFNGDGLRANTEPGLPGVTVYLDLNGNNQHDPGELGTAGEPLSKTAGDGKYLFQLNAVGNFRVREVVPAGFKLTSNPTPPDVVVNGTGDFRGPDFGNQSIVIAVGGAIRGNVFRDFNGNGTRESNETGFGGVAVFLDLNGNGKLDPGNSPSTPGEPFVSTSNTGVYELKAPSDGTFAVRTVAPAGTTLTTPTPADVTVAGGKQVVGPDFGYKSNVVAVGGTIHGSVFIDANGDGLRNNNEVGQPGVVIFLDLNSNGKLDPGTTGTTSEPATLSGNNGEYNLKVATDGTFAVAEVVPINFKQTAPTPPITTVTVAGGATVAGPLFGNQTISVGGIIRGSVFNDVDGDGTRDPNEGGLGNVIVFLDLNNNGKLDIIAPGAPGEPSTKSALTGHYELKASNDGTFAVRTVDPANFTLTTPTPADITVAGGKQVVGPEFGYKHNVVVPVGGVIRGLVFVDRNGDGLQSATEPGQAGVIVYLDLNNNGKLDPGTNTGNLGEPFTKSGTNGHYELKAATDGTFSVAEVVPIGFKQTAPTPPVASVTLAGGVAVTGPKFGNQPLTNSNFGAVQGQVFLDVNNNAKHDPIEPGIPGIRVYDDANNNGKFDSGEIHTQSNYAGRYVLRLMPGVHQIREVVPPLYVETVAPGPVTIVAGQVVRNQDFGLRWTSFSLTDNSGSSYIAPDSSDSADSSTLPLDYSQSPSFLGGVFVDG